MHTSLSLVWKHFYALCAIPRPSGHERAAVEYVRDVAESLKLDWRIDNAGNIIVRKKASMGLEGRTGIVLQSHLDMVPQKNEGTKHDFLKDPIETYIDDDGWVRAKGTTLGADNGIGAAVALATLEDVTLKHGPLEALFTVGEEDGMNGARELEPDALLGQAFINLDTEDEGEIYIGCAGGADITANIPIDWVKVDNTAPNKLSGYVSVLLSVTGLTGGHSGLDINLGRGNAIKILSECLYWLNMPSGVKIISMRGGSARNAIPREAFCELAVHEKDLDSFAYHIRITENALRSGLMKSDPDIKLVAAESGKIITRVMTDASQKRLIDALYNCPNGVEAMSDEAPDVVETSGNLAIVNTDDDAVVKCLIRSSISAARDSLAAKTATLFKQHDATVRISGEYPGWKADYGSRLLQTMKTVYTQTFGETPAVKVVHAGLECGIIADKYHHMEFVSVGPTVKHPHSPDERLCVKSVEKFWTYITAVLSHDF